MVNQIVKDTFTLVLTYEMSVNTDTGEILETKLINREVSKPTVKKQKLVVDESDEPKLFLEENKYRLNSAAINLLGVTAGDKLDIKYKDDKPVIGVDDKAGNKITKSNTVLYKGNKNEELAKHGHEFKLISHPSIAGLFILDSGKAPEIIEDNIVSITEEDEDLPFDLDLDKLVEDEDTNIEEIDSNFFKF